MSNQPQTKTPQVFSHKSYCKIENNGKYHVIEIGFDPSTLKTGDAKIIESNTDRYIIEERLHVLLFSNDVL